MTLSPEAGAVPITFREIDDENRAAVLALSVRPQQRSFVSTVADSLDEAKEYPEGKPWYRAVYMQDQPVGFVMLSWDCTPVPGEIWGPWFLWKLLIDQRHQGKGYGREVVRQVAALVLAQGATELLTSHATGSGSPASFYERMGFVPTGETDPEGEPILRLDLAAR